MVTMDVAALTLAAASAVTDSSALLAGAGALYLLGPTAIHAYQDRSFAIMATSIGMRAAFPATGALLGYAIDRNSCGPEEWFCGLGGFVVGFMSGYVAAVVVDDGLLAGPRQEWVEPRRYAARGISVRGAGVLPGPGGATMAITGTF